MLYNNSYNFYNRRFIFSSYILNQILASEK
uniref:Uncharacterized protein n=1 Tax=Anguilla anguilla TaxID=7936 RepID=A0A0E9WHD8_ANGAN